MTIATKTARFPGRVEKRRKVALANREKNIKLYSSNGSMSDEQRADKISKAQADVDSLRKSLRIST